VFRKPSAIPLTQEPDFHGFPQCRFCVLKLLGLLAGLARAKDQGICLGRRRLEDCDAGEVTAIKRALAAKRGVRRIARDLKTGVGTVLRIKNGLAVARNSSFTYKCPSGEFLNQVNQL
jgi:hypothetical protein